MTFYVKIKEMNEINILFTGGIFLLAFLSILGVIFNTLLNPIKQDIIKLEKNRKEDIISLEKGRKEDTTRLESKIDMLINHLITKNKS